MHCIVFVLKSILSIKAVSPFKLCEIMAAMHANIANGQTMKLITFKKYANEASNPFVFLEIVLVCNFKLIK